MPISSAPAAVRARPARWWWVAPSMILAGAVVWGAAGIVGGQRESGAAQTVAVATDARAAVAALRADAAVAVAGDPTAGDRMEQDRARLQDDVGVLDRGGYASWSTGEVDRVATPPAADRPAPANTPLSPLWSALDHAVDPIASHADALTAAATVQARLNDDIAQTQARSAVLQSGVWTTPAYIGNARALQSVVQNNALWGMPLAVLAPAWPSSVVEGRPDSDARARVVAQWSATLSDAATRATAIATQADADSQLASAERLQAHAAADAWRALLADVQALTAADPVRTAATAALPTLQAPADALNQAAQTIALASAPAPTSAAWSAPGHHPTAAAQGLGAALVLVGAVLALVALVRMTDVFWRAEHEHQSGALAIQALHRLNSATRKVVNRETPAQRLSESSQSPGFALASLINRVLEQRDEAAALLSDLVRTLSEVAAAVDGDIHRVGGSRTESGAYAAALSAAWDRLDATGAALDQALKRQSDAQNDVNAARDRWEALATDIGWQINTLRENTQGLSKRVKRQGEDAQAMNVTAGALAAATQKVRVVALNMSVAAAAQGDEGRAAASLANELKRLADEMDAALATIDDHVENLQESARESASVAEDNTSALVALSEPVHELLAAAEAARAPLSQSASAGSEATHQRGTGAATAREARHVLGDWTEVSDALGATAEALRERAATVRESVQAMRRWLTRYGLDS